jgi:hypothetical protein
MAINNRCDGSRCHNEAGASRVPLYGGHVSSPGRSVAKRQRTYPERVFNQARYFRSGERNKKTADLSGRRLRF